eukprot:g3338.t1
MHVRRGLICAAGIGVKMTSSLTLTTKRVGDGETPEPNPQSQEPPQQARSPYCMASWAMCHAMGPEYEQDGRREFVSHDTAVTKCTNVMDMISAGHLAANQIPPQLTREDYLNGCEMYEQTLIQLEEQRKMDGTAAHLDSMTEQAENNQRDVDVGVQNKITTGEPERFNLAQGEDDIYDHQDSRDPEDDLSALDALHWDKAHLLHKKEEVFDLDPDDERRAYK